MTNKAEPEEILALNFLRGLHPEVTVDEPMEVAHRIFDSVMAERREFEREKENMLRNIKTRDEILQSQRTSMATKDAALKACVEAAAQAIYEQWAHLPGYVPWVAGGNSRRQDDARAIARTAITRAKEAQS